MSVVGANYRLSDGQITGRIVAETREVLLLNHDPATEGMIEIEKDHPFSSCASRWRVESGGLVKIGKAELHADKISFVADGADQVRITATGVPLPIEITAIPLGVFTLSDEDPVLVLSSEAPMHFRFYVQQPNCWSEILDVKAH